MKYTFICGKDGEPTTCTGAYCDEAYSVKEFAGFCENCWIHLTPAERAILKGEEPPVKEVVTHRTVEHHYPPKPSAVPCVLEWVWRFTITILVAYLALRVRMHR